MCEIFGLSSQNGFKANEYLKTFFSHSDHHPHGWGLACVSREAALIEKESLKASKSNYLRERDTPQSVMLSAKTAIPTRERTAAAEAGR